MSQIYFTRLIYITQIYFHPQTGVHIKHVLATRPLLHSASDFTLGFDRSSPSSLLIFTMGLYGTTQADWGNAVFLSFCLVYCKACSTLTKTGNIYIFPSKFHAKWWQYAHYFIFSAEHLVWSQIIFENSPQSRNFKIQFIL